jgi:hypothetical protein
MAASLYLLLLSILIQTSHMTADVRKKNNPTSFNIGGVLSNNESMMFFKQTISVSTTVFKILIY